MLIFEILDLFRDFILIIQIFILLFYILIHKKKYVFLQSAFLLILTYFLAQIISFYFPSTRPINYFFDLDDSYLKNSFPSRHSAITSMITLILFDNNYKFIFLSLLFSILIFFLSILSLRHWPQDVISGIIISILIFFLFKFLLNFFKRFYIKNS